VEDLAALHNFRIEAFTVANVGHFELEEKLKELARDVWQNHNQDFKLFEKQARDLMAQYVPYEDIPPSGWLKTNLNTAINSSYNAAQYNRLQDSAVKDVYPAYKYMTRNDSRVRDSHRILHEKVFRSNDPIWSEIWPPNGWNCRCYVIPLSGEEVGEPESMLRSGEYHKTLTKNISKDFRRNAGTMASIWGKWLQSQLEDKKIKMSQDMVKFANQMPEPETIIEDLKQKASKFRYIEYTKENYDKEFPSGYAKTPLGDFRLGDDFFRKLGRRDRQDLLGIVKPTLEKPVYILIDKEDGILFLRAYKKDDNLIYAGIVKQVEGEPLIISFYDKRNVANKVKEGKLLIYSFRPESGASGGEQEFADAAGHLDFTNINNSDNKENPRIKDYNDFELIVRIEKSKELKEILQNPDEVWGETYNRDGKVNSELNYIRFGIDGFQTARTNNAEIYEFKNVDYSHLDDYRIGTLLYKAV